MTWEEIFTSSNPAGGRMINVQSGVAGSEASPYTSDNPSGGRCINVNVVSGGVSTGVLQLASGVPLDTTLRAVTDQANTASPLQLSTTQVFVDSGSASTGYPLVVSVAANTSSGLNIKNRTSTIGMRLFSSNGSTAFPYIGAYDSSGGGTYPLTFGVENATLMAIGATNVGIGLAYPFTTSARLHVRGDGTNPIARFESSSAASYLQLNSTGADLILYNSAARFLFHDSNTTIGRSSNSILFTGYYASTDSSFKFETAGGTISGPLSGTKSFADLNVGTIALAAGSANFRPLNIAYTINNSGAQSGTATGIFLNATETLLNGMTHNLMDLQVGGVSKFKISNIGGITTSGSIVSSSWVTVGASTGLDWSGRSNITSAADGRLMLANNAQTGFDRLQFGGTTNAFPAIKRNGAGIDFKLADDSAYCNITPSGISTRQNSSGANMIVHIDNLGVNKFATHMSAGNLYLYNYATTLNVYSIGANDSICFGNTVAVASAKVQIDSTTQGFLPPRMTTAQRDAIGTPAAGLVIYNTTTNKLNVYTTAWEQITSA